jgi:type IV pilus assembly protein PilV
MTAWREMMSKEKRSTVKDIQKITGKEGGFTLLEVIMAVSILTIGLLAVAAMQASAIRGNAMSMTYSESTEKVQDRVEKILNSNLAVLTDRTLDGINGLNDTGDDADWPNPPDTSNQEYKVYWNVVEDYAGGTVVRGVNTIRIIVVWQERGTEKSYSFDILRNRI